MATSLANASIYSAGVLSRTETASSIVYGKTQLQFPPKATTVGLKARKVFMQSSPATPPDLSERVEKSIKEAEQACAEDSNSGECAAAWDEVEELSATASHTREKLKENSDPLENYCKENPETDECRTYE